MQETYIEVNHLKKVFKGQKVLEDVSFQIKSGDLIRIKGINGSGKSTIFKIICDILSPDAGEVKIREGIEIGALIENPYFIERVTAMDNFRFLASILDRFDEEKIKKYSQLLRFDLYNRSKLKSYSVGMRQKVGIIQAVMEDQKVILLDEPTRGLDEESLKGFKLLIKGLMEEGKAIVIIAHDNLAEIPFTTTYTLIDGCLIEA